MQLKLSGAVTCLLRGLSAVTQMRPRTLGPISRSLLGESTSLPGAVCRDGACPTRSKCRLKSIAAKTQHITASPDRAVNGCGSVSRLGRGAAAPCRTPRSGFLGGCRPCPPTTADRGEDHSPELTGKALGCSLRIGYIDKIVRFAGRC